MQDEATPLEQLQQIETYVRGLLGYAQSEELSTAARHAIANVRKTATIARKFLRDYAHEEDARAQARILPQSIECLEGLRRHILEASQHDVFTAVDVAQLTAQLDQLIERLR